MRSQTSPLTCPMVFLDFSSPSLPSIHTALLASVSTHFFSIIIVYRSFFWCKKFMFLTAFLAGPGFREGISIFNRSTFSRNFQYLKVWLFPTQTFEICLLIFKCLSFLFVCGGRSPWHGSSQISLWHRSKWYPPLQLYGYYISTENIGCFKREYLCCNVDQTRR